MVIDGPNREMETNLQEGCLSTTGAGPWHRHECLKVREKPNQITAGSAAMEGDINCHDRTRL